MATTHLPTVQALMDTKHTRTAPWLAALCNCLSSHAFADLFHAFADLFPVPERTANIGQAGPKLCNYIVTCMKCMLTSRTRCIVAQLWCQGYHETLAWSQGGEAKTQQGEAELQRGEAGLLKK